MTIRRSNGGAHVETLQADEQAVGVPAPGASMASLQAPTLKRSTGRIADSQTAAELGRRGGLARAAKARQLRALSGLGLLGATPESLKPFLEAANQFAEAEVERLARECGGGVCPQNAAALVQGAALAMAGSREAYSRGDAVMGARLGVEVRQNLLGARDLTVLEAKSRKHPANGQRPLAPWERPK